MGSYKIQLEIEVHFGTSMEKLAQKAATATGMTTFEVLDFAAHYGIRPHIRRNLEELARQVKK